MAGAKVLCRGRLSVYEPNGRYQLVVERMQPTGIGDLAAAFEALKEKLSKEVNYCKQKHLETLNV